MFIALTFVTVYPNIELAIGALAATVHNEPAIYVTLEEPAYSITNNMLRFNWDLVNLGVKEKIAFIDASHVRREIPYDVNRYLTKTGLEAEKFDLTGLISLIEEAHRRIKATTCVIDSVTSLLLKYNGEFEMRQKLFELDKALSGMGLTTLMLLETREERRDVQTFGIESFLAQGVIVLHMFRLEDVLVRALEIRKMRGVRNSEKLCLYRITDEGIEVYPNEQIFQQ